ncbi:molybdate ABC transporter permease subunit [Chitinimonas lacunae]|uniref:Molybdenum transport system permease n=1 Tax=Chitinimonas lacunae TaxID=1963018 RepID=A0ABV8MLW1_9NEIS
MTPATVAALWLTFKLAATTTLLLLLLGTPLAWWLARTRSRWRAPLAAIVALPLVLPPTVLGFYLLLALGPHGPLGRLTETLGLGLLPFSFAGLLFASLLYSAPFVVQPLQAGFEALDEAALEAAATLRAGPWDRFFHVVLPLSRPALAAASVMGFAHTVGEFGVVLMIGGNIAGETRVLSVLLYDHVEALEYGEAHRIAAGLLGFSFVSLWALHAARRRGKGGWLGQ